MCKELRVLLFFEKLYYLKSFSFWFTFATRIFYYKSKEYGITGLFKNQLCGAGWAYSLYWKILLLLAQTQSSIDYMSQNWLSSKFNTAVDRESWAWKNSSANPPQSGKFCRKIGRFPTYFHLPQFSWHLPGNVPKGGKNSQSISYSFIFLPVA